MEAILLEEKRIWSPDRRNSSNRVWWRRIWDNINQLLYIFDEIWAVNLVWDPESKDLLISISQRIKEKINSLLSINNDVSKLLMHYKWHALECIMSADLFIKNWFLTKESVWQKFIKYLNFAEKIINLHENEIINKLNNISTSTQSEVCINQIEEALWIEKYSEVFLN